MESWYSKDQVAFIKVNGQFVWELSNMYRVREFPYFIAIDPSKGGAEKSVFRSNSRTYDSFKWWMIETMGEVPLRTNDTKIFEELEQKTIGKVLSEVQNVLSDIRVRNSDT